PPARSPLEGGGGRLYPDPPVALPPDPRQRALRAAVRQKSENAVDARPAVGIGDGLDRKIAARLDAGEIRRQRHAVVSQRGEAIGWPPIGGEESPLEIGALGRIGGGVPAAACRRVVAGSGHVPYAGAQKLRRLVV